MSENAGVKKKRKFPIDQTTKLNDVLEHNLFESLNTTYKAPRELVAIVRYIVEYEAKRGDFQFTNTDPFHFKEINKTRIEHAGEIKGYRKFKYAYVEVPLLYNNMFSTAQGTNVSFFSLTRIDITSLKRKLNIGEKIYISFADFPDGFERPVFKRFRSEKEKVVASADQTNVQTIDGKAFGVEESDERGTT
tara:strand:- start:101 stop:673 length:573 start_codon:yes stop_codon:yes gene_type:complete